MWKLLDICVYCERTSKVILLADSIDIHSSHHVNVCVRVCSIIFYYIDMSYSTRWLTGRTKNLLFCVFTKFKQRVTCSFPTINSTTRVLVIAKKYCSFHLENGRSNSHVFDLPSLITKFLKSNFYSTYYFSVFSLY